MDQRPEDPVLHSARHEARVALIVWLVALGYTVGYCVCYGYGRAWDQVTFVLGFPDWVFWGIVLPWLVSIAVSWWYAYRFMTDEPLGGAESDADRGVNGPGDFYDA